MLLLQVTLALYLACKGGARNGWLPRSSWSGMTSLSSAG